MSLPNPTFLPKSQNLLSDLGRLMHGITKRFIFSLRSFLPNFLIMFASQEENGTETMALDAERHVHPSGTGEEIETAEQTNAGKTLKRLLSLLVPDNRVRNNPESCHLYIGS